MTKIHAKLKLKRLKEKPVPKKVKGIELAKIEIKSAATDEFGKRPPRGSRSRSASVRGGTVHS
jgi:hypothetical protein